MIVKGRTVKTYPLPRILATNIIKGTLEMLSLKEQALLAATKEKTTFGELITFCDSNQEIKDVCYYSKTFWRKMLPLVGLGLEALCFEPLKDEYWRGFIQGLVDGVSYKKYFEFEEYDEDLEVDNSTSLLLYTLPQAELNLPDFSKKNFCYIPSIKFPSNTEGWIIEFSFDQVLADIKNVFVLSDKNDDRDRLVDLITLMYSDKLRQSNAKYKPYAIVRDINVNHVRDESGKNIWMIAEADGLNIFEFDKNEFPSKDFIKSLVEEDFGEMYGPHWLNFRLKTFLKNPYTDYPENYYDEHNETTFNIYRCRIY